MANMGARKGSADKSGIPHTRIDEESWIDKYYEVGEKIGQGMFGKVFKVKHKETGEYWAMKVINKEKAGSSAIKLLEREVDILKKVDHDNIIKLNEVFETSTKMYLVMELCESGELADVLKEKETFSEDDTKVITTKLAGAISYLHKRDIVHRDIKLENILLSQNPTNPSDKLHIKVTDFGLSVVKGGVGHDNMMQDFCGTPIYMSPEILDNKAYSQQCDVWAMGIITFSLLCGSPPFKASTEEELYDMIRKGEIDFTTDPVWAGISNEAKNCIELMLKTDPAHRISASEVLHHTWITVKRFQRKRKAPLERAQPVKITKKDVNLAAESLLELSNLSTSEQTEIESEGIQRESRNVLDLMKDFKKEQEEEQKSAINGEVENGDDCQSEEKSEEKTETRKGSAETKKPGSGGKSGSSNKSISGSNSQKLSPGQRNIGAKSPGVYKGNNSKSSSNNLRGTAISAGSKPTAVKKKT